MLFSYGGNLFFSSFLIFFSKKPEIVWKIESKSKQGNNNAFEQISNLDYEENKNKENNEVKINEEVKNKKRCIFKS